MTPVRRTAARLVALLLLASPLGAQGTIRGTLVDSLRSGGAVVGADVVLMGANRKTVTARGGSFEFTDVPEGQYIVAYWAPWLDSLGLPAIQRQVNVRGRRTETVTLATPSNATIQRAVCGEVLGAEQGILIGEIRDGDGMPAAGTGVFAQWLETVVQGREVAQGTMAAADSASASGSYALCGVPVGSEFSLRAVGRGGSSGELLVETDASLHRRDIIVAASGVTSSVTGRVLTSAGAPIAGAAVLVVGDSTQSVRSDSTGRFVMPSLPRRSSQLMVRAVGYTPVMRAVDPIDTQMDLDVVTLPDAPRELATVTVTGEAMTASQLQFEARKERGLGVFVSDEQLSKIGLVSAQTIATFNPRIAVQQTRRGPTMLMRRGSEFCRPQFFVDGVNFRNIEVDEENNILRMAKRVEFYTANNAPQEFNDFAGCGSVVIWTY
jgi:hypothetical protein